MKTTVKFLVHEGTHPDFPDIFAYFPEELGDMNGNKTSYAHIGQHSACSPEYANKSRLATEQEYADLKEELESIGYELLILN